MRVLVYDTYALCGRHACIRTCLQTTQTGWLGYYVSSFQQYSLLTTLLGIIKNLSLHVTFHSWDES